MFVAAIRPGTSHEFATAGLCAVSLAFRQADRRRGPDVRGEHDLPVSDKERAQWMLHRLADGRGICNIGFAVQVPGAVRWWPLQAAVNHVVARHPALRAVIRVTGSQLRKVLVPPEDATVDVDSVHGTEQNLHQQLTDLLATPFAVERAPLVRAQLIMLPTTSVICVVLHHLVADAFTAEVVLSELIRCYESFAETERPPADLTGTAALHLEPPADEAAVAYWLQRLKGVDPGRLALAGARAIHGKPTFAGDRLARPLSAAGHAAVTRLRQRLNSTDNIVMLAAFELLLARHGAGPDLVVGVPVTSRRTGAGAGVAGYHADTLPIRVLVDPDASFEALAGDTREVFLDALANGATSFESVQHGLTSRSPDWRVPLFRHSFNFRPTGFGEPAVTGTPVRVIDAHHGMSRLDLELIVWAGRGSMDLTLVFSTEVHERAEMAALLDRYEALLLALADDPGMPAGDIDLTTAADRDLLRRVNATTRELPAGGVLDWILATARRTPAASAVDDWTYDRLVTAAAGVRDRLSGLGIGPRDVVGLHLPRGPELAAAVLGTWLAGAAYLPLDTSHPAARIGYQLSHAGVRLVLTGPPLPAGCDGDWQVVPIGDIPPARDTGATPGRRAYVIHTSGSTGRPKGVEVGHAGLANLVAHFTALLAVTSADTVLWSTTFSFDISALELLLPLCAGGRVVTAPDDVRLSGRGMRELIADRNVTIVQATPTAWRHLLTDMTGELSGVRVLCGGEPVTAELAERLLAKGCRLFNVYGPTETTIWSSVAELRTPVARRVPIGLPIANTTVHVLDEALRPVPPGVPGELCIGGAGVALGYLGEPGMTADRFPSDPVRGRYYRTGDVVLLRADGQMEFLGRTDRQVKVRGHRVELGEVEAVLEEHSAVAAVAVLVEPAADGLPALAAAVRFADDAGEPDRAVAAERLYAYAAERLPAATVPARFVPVEDFPQTGNGKVDYRALATILTRGRDQRAALPGDPTTRALVELWRDVLEDQRLTADANFFLSGGHSLLAIRLAALAGERLGTPVEFDTVFAAPTPALLATWLTGRKEDR
jgi:amino acid adenylation domain-containing protein